MKWALLLLLVLCYPALTQDSNCHENKGVTPEIQVGDLLNISVWSEPDLTRTLQVERDGKISFPLLGHMQAAGLTPKKLEKVITEKLRRYVRNPRGSVSV